MTPSYQNTRDDDDTTISLAISSLSLRQGKVTLQSKDAHPPPKTPHVSPSIFYRAWGGGSSRLRARARDKHEKEHLTSRRRAANTQPYQPLPVVGLARASTGTSDTS